MRLCGILKLAAHGHRHIKVGFGHALLRYRCGFGLLLLVFEHLDVTLGWLSCPRLGLCAAFDRHLVALKGDGAVVKFLSHILGGLADGIVLIPCYLGRVAPVYLGGCHLAQPVLKRLIGIRTTLDQRDECPEWPQRFPNRTPQGVKAHL